MVWKKLAFDDDPPAAHESSHVSGGSDEIDSALGIAAMANLTNGKIWAGNGSNRPVEEDKPAGDMAKSTYDPNEDGVIALAQLDGAVCSETEADGKITTHGTGAKHRWTLNKLRKGAGAGADPTEVDPYTHPTTGTCPQAPKAHTLNSHTAPTANISMNSKKITTLGTPTSTGHALRKGTRITTTELPALTLNKIWKGTGANPTEIDVPVNTITESEKVSEVLRNSNDTVRSTNSTSYVKLKEIKLNADLAACRVKFDLEGHSGSTGRCYVYKNGVEIGTLRQKNNDGFETFSEDFAGWVTNDLIQLYVSTTNVINYARVQNFRFHYDDDDHITHIIGADLAADLALEGRDPTISTTNQDP